MISNAKFIWEKIVFLGWNGTSVELAIASNPKIIGISNFKLQILVCQTSNSPKPEYNSTKTELQPPHSDFSKFGSNNPEKQNFKHIFEK